MMRFLLRYSPLLLLALAWEIHRADSFSPWRCRR